MKNNDRVVATVSIVEAPNHTGTSMATAKMFNPETITPGTVQDIILGLITLQEITSSSENCPGEEHLCGTDCMCYIGTISAAMLEILLSGPSHDEASMFLQEQFEINQGTPRVLH